MRDEPSVKYIKAKWLTASSDDPDLLLFRDRLDAHREIRKVPRFTGTDRLVGLISPMNMAQRLNEELRVHPFNRWARQMLKPNLKQLKSLLMNLRALGFV